MTRLTTMVCILQCSTAKGRPDFLREYARVCVADALILKTFVFQFANAYFTLWYEPAAACSYVALLSLIQLLRKSLYIDSYRYIAFVKSSPFFRKALSMDPDGAEQCMLKEYCDLQGQVH